MTKELFLTIYFIFGFCYWCINVFVRKMESRENPWLNILWFLLWWFSLALLIIERTNEYLFNSSKDTDEYLIKGRTYKRLKEEYYKYNSLWIYVDFDNTIYDYHKKGYTYTKMIDLLISAQMIGMKIVIFTANNQEEMIKQYCKDIGLIIEGINLDGIPLGWSSRKPFYSLLLDDRAGIVSAYRDLRKLVNEVHRNLLDEKYVSEL